MYISNRVSSIGRKIFNKKLKYLLSWFFFQRIKASLFWTFHFFFHLKSTKAICLFSDSFRFLKSVTVIPEFFFWNPTKSLKEKQKKKTRRFSFSAIFMSLSIFWKSTQKSTKVEKNWKTLELLWTNRRRKKIFKHVSFIYAESVGKINEKKNSKNKKLR